MAPKAAISPELVHDTLANHLLVDGYPLVIDLEASHGSFIVDRLSGREYLDFFSFFASNPIGFNHPRMLEGDVQERLLRAATTRIANSDVYSHYLAEFVATLSASAGPPELPHYFFIDGGALAVENGMKVAFDWKVQKNLADGRFRPNGPELGTKILHFEGAFHGRSGYTLSVTNTDPVKTKYFPKFDWPRVSTPFIHFPLDEMGIEQVMLAERRSLDAIEAAFDQHAHDIAAILIEPVQGEGGDRHFRPEFLRALRRIANEREALLIFDEVQTGLGLTGRWWAYQHMGVVPDVLCFAKKMQVGGVFVSNRVDDVPNNVFSEPSRINSTWGASLVDMVRCTRILEIIEEERLLDNATSRGAELIAGLRKLEARFEGIVTGSRGLGLMCAIDLPSRGIRDVVIDQCYEGGMIVLPCGDRSVRFRPSLNVSSEQIGEGVHRLSGAIEIALRKTGMFRSSGSGTMPSVRPQAGWTPENPTLPGLPTDDDVKSAE
jgi:L-lysine 6-transaminase